MMLSKVHLAVLLLFSLLKFGNCRSLSKTELLIQRWFSQLTFLQSSEQWDNWGDAVNDVDCDGNTCVRYEIAGLFYGAAVQAYSTPAYLDVNKKILKDCIYRMINKIAWQYVELFNDFKEQPTYPDPVAYKNIMYSGHLAQMILMFESITGDFTFSTNGWNFTWGEDSEFPTPIPYNTKKLLDRIYDQVLAYEIGGVPCEPDSIFVICNNYPQNAFLMYDSIHSAEESAYANVTVPLWQETILHHGVNRVPPVEQGDNNFFNLDYLIKPLGIWEPIASIGSDVWALAWMKAWWDFTPRSGSSNAMGGISKENAATLLQDAFNSIRNSSCWVTVDNATAVSATSTATDSTTAATYPQAFLRPGKLAQSIFPFSEAMTTSFYPMISKQFRPSSAVSSPSFSASPAAAAAEEEELEASVYRYFDSNYGRYLDSDGDGVVDSFQYNTARDQCTGSETNCPTGDYSIWATANLLIGKLLPEHDPDFLRSMVRGTPLYQQTANQPKLLHVEYPHVQVSQAQYELWTGNDNIAGTLVIELCAGDNPPLLPQFTTIEVQNPLPPTSKIEVRLNKAMYDKFTVSGDDRILIDVPGWRENDAAVPQSVDVVFFL